MKNLMIALAALALGAGCKSNPKAGSNTATLRSADVVQQDAKSWKEVFLDEPQNEDVRVAISECLKAFGMKSLSFAPWPSELKGLLIDEAESMPIAGDILKGLRGLYLVEGMTDFSGLACGAKLGAPQPVVFDEKVFVTKRKKLGALGKELAYPMQKSGKRGSISGTKGDFALDTFVHELMHVYASQKQSVFKSLTELSWKTATTDKFGITAKLGLADGDKGADDWSYDPVACRRGGDEEETASGLGLEDSARENALKRDTDDGNLHKKLIESTNFIDQYASTNAHEDFAETATIFWRGSVRNDWPEYEYRERMQDGRQALIFGYEPKKIARTSKAHHEKLCKFGQAIFKKDCAALQEEKKAEKKADGKDAKAKSKD